MEREDVKARIQRVVLKATNMRPERLTDTVSFRRELELDSLSLLEIGVEVDYEFGLGLPDERYAEIDNVEQAADLVLAELATRATPGG